MREWGKHIYSRNSGELLLAGDMGKKQSAVSFIGAARICDPLFIDQKKGGNSSPFPPLFVYASGFVRSCDALLREGSACDLIGCADIAKGILINGERQLLYS